MGERWLESEKGPATLARLRANDPKLTELYPYESGLGPQGATALAEGLKANTALVKLDLSCNRDIGNAGTAALGVMLESNTTLQKLGLEKCGLGPQGATALAEGLKTNTALVKLDLRYNPGMSKAGTAALGAMLASNTTLWELSLTGCDLDILFANGVDDFVRRNVSRL